MGKIRVLPNNLINLIAAGEVVERPASVVKELIENSLDAGATKITLKVSEGGLANITVVDDGSGMDEEDARLAFAQHATSKLASVEDLENIITLGFRGEALASISAVSQVLMETKSAETAPVKIEIVASELKTLNSAKTTQGTSISISNLFEAIPARKKFLRTAATESDHIVNTFISLSLVNLAVHFELYHNDNLVYRLPRASNFTERVFSLWGAKTAEKLYNSEISQPGVKLTSWVGSPDIARKDRKLQYIFVNKRIISDRLVQKAVSEAYKGFIHKDLQPVYFLILDIDPKLVDVNVHPRKQEVKFSNSQQIYQLVLTSVRNLLEKSTKQDLLARISSGHKYEETGSAGGRAEWQLADSARLGRPGKFSSASGAPKSRLNIQRSLSFTQEILQPLAKGEGTTEQDAGENTAADLSTTFAGGFQPLQVFNTYIVYENNDEVIFIDQHAAAEKILFEKLNSQHANQKSMPLLIPLIIELTPSEKRQVLQLIDKLATLGIILEDFGGNAIQVTELPELTPKLDVQAFLQELLDKDLGDSMPEAKSTRTKTKALKPSSPEKGTPVSAIVNEGRRDVLATLACHSAIRAGQKLSVPEMYQLISDLAKCQDPYSCPHGRPVSWTMSRYDLEKNFKRNL